MNPNFFYPSSVMIGKGIYQKFLDTNDLHISRLFVITGKKSMQDAGVLNKIKELTKKHGVECFIFSGIESSPTNSQVDKICQLSKEFKSDCILGIGGASSIDVAKIVGMQSTNGGKSWDYINLKERPAKKVINDSLPVIAIPTTSGGGSESTPYAVITNSDTKMKKGIKSEKLYPKLAIIDLELLELMPKRIVSNSGFDAFTQSLEAYASKNSNFISDFFALKSLELIFLNFEKSWEDSKNIYAREKMAIASLLSGLAIGITDTNLAHAMSHPLSAHYNVPHGVAVLLCTLQSIQFNKSIVNDKYSDITKLLNNKNNKNHVEFLIDKIHKWAKKFGVSLCFQDYDIPKTAIDSFVSDSLKIGGILTNPRPINSEQLKNLYEKAWTGKID